jgi:2-polyprenyl-3-methyl-5-hydroxy-6-metoxy-1,4-benzoquinol methylase
LTLASESADVHEAAGAGGLEATGNWQAEAASPAMENLLEERASEGCPAADPDDRQPPLEVCPICGGRYFTAKYRIGGMRIEACAQCGLAFQNPQASNRQLNDIYGPNYFLFSSDDPVAAHQFEFVKRATARLQLADLAAYLAKRGRSPQGLRLLEIGCGHGNFLREARDAGYGVQGLDYSAHAAATANRNLGCEAVRVGTSPDGQFEAGSFDVCLLADVIEHVRDPRRFLADLVPLLDRDGVVYLATPNLDSVSAKAMGRRWMEYKVEHLYYFSARSITRLLRELGFTSIETAANRKVLTADYMISHFDRYPVPGLGGAMRLARRVIPDRLLRMPLQLSVGGLSVFATRP